MVETVSFGQDLKRRRKEQDLTQNALAEEVGCSVDTIKKIERGVLRPSRQLAELLAATLEIEPSERELFVRLSRSLLLRHNGSPPGTSEPQAPIAASPSPDGRRAPSNLPIPPTSLVGREQDVAIAVSLLLGKNVRLLTLTGPPGIGKTRLALQVAAELAGHFRHGAVFVNLASTVDPLLVAPGIAQALGVREGEGRSVDQSLAAYLRDKHLLLVLDNFEQIEPAAPLVADLLAAAPDLVVLATSRSRLHVRGEHELPVPPLSMPDLDAQLPFDQLVQYASARLFVERAVAIKPDFEVTDENASEIAEICRRLDGLPLAIELAAARIKILPPRAILNRLENRLKLLTGGEQDLPARQRTLRAAIEWSYDLLEEEEKKLFRRLAVFQGGRSLGAIDAVCNAGVSTSGNSAPVSSLRPLTPLRIDVLDGVASLVDQSLLQQEEGYGGEPRFVFLETIHEFAREKLDESGEAYQVQERHADFFLALAEETEPFLMGIDQQKWLEKLEQESDNFRTALTWCLRLEIESPEARRRLETGLRMVAALSPFWTRHSHMREGRSWIETAVSRAGTFPDLRRGSACARALYGAGVIAFTQSDQQAAASVLEESLSIYKDLGGKQGVANTLTYLGLVKGYLERRVEEGRPLLEESVRLHRELGDTWGLALAISCLGYLPLVEREYGKARTLFEEALLLFERLGDIWAVGWVKLITGEAARCQGDYETAAALYEQSMALHRELGDKHRIAVASNNLGYVNLHQGNLDRASAYLRESMTLLHESGSESRMLSGFPGLAGLARASGKMARAARLLGAAQAQAEACRFNFEPPELLAFEQNVASLRAEMDEASFHNAWEEGRSMTWNQAMSYALDES